MTVVTLAYLVLGVCVGLATGVSLTAALVFVAVMACLLLFAWATK